MINKTIESAKDIERTFNTCILTLKTMGSVLESDNSNFTMSGVYLSSNKVKVKLFLELKTLDNNDVTSVIIKASSSDKDKSSVEAIEKLKDSLLNEEMSLINENNYGEPSDDIKYLLNSKESKKTNKYPALTIIRLVSKINAYITIVATLILVIKPEYFWGINTELNKFLQIMFIIMIGVTSVIMYFAFAELIGLLLSINKKINQK